MLDVAFHRAATIIIEGKAALERLADLLISSNGIPGKVAAGIVASALGPKLGDLQKRLDLRA
jgi:hypothetical protein